MTEYIIKRLLLLIPTLLGALIILYLIMNILPGDVVQLILGAEEGSASPELLAAIRHEMGLDKPFYMRMSSWFWNAAQLDFGHSLYSGVSVIKEMSIRLPITFTMMFIAVVTSAFLSIPLGIFMALNRNSVWDYALRMFLIGGISIPSFWVAILVVVTLLVVFHWFPPIQYATIFTDPMTSAKQLIFPGLVLGYRPVATQARMLRSMMLEVMGEDYIRTARAKGMPERVVIWLHVLKNSLPPVVTLLGMEAAVLIAATVIIEVVFGVPGIGSMLVRSIERRDITMVQGIMTLVLVFVIVTNLVVDVAYSFLDPRIRYGRRG